MRKILTFLLLCAFAVTASAVPARRGWQTRVQADGTTIEVQQFGDEFYHYMINRAGQEVREINGMYEVVGEAPSPTKIQARRAKGVARRQRKAVGTEPNLAPKGVVILASFSDNNMQAGHTLATFTELFNATNCTVNQGYPSAAQYFADQSNGAYRPQFDVFGPVKLSRNMAYYGTDKPGQDEGDDQHATDAVVEACILANQNYTINWADYDSDKDGYIDFVYVVHAGYGQADGGASTTIWPHNWEVSEARTYGYCTYTKDQCKVGGKIIETYAISAELDCYANTLNGIGTLCHEFGHVMGLPDWYDTDYGTNYNNCLTPGDWDVMDGGAYGGDGHCPPNYSPWEKYFFGWHTPVNLGNTGASLTLYPNGTENYQAYQINASGTQQGPTTSGWCYFIENRQQVGWDRGLTASGMLIWKVNFNASAWENNVPNNSNTSGAPLYTIISATGTKIGWDGSTDHCPKNTFPGTGNKTSYTGISGKPLLNIAESGQLITLTYIEEPEVEPFEITWKADGDNFASTTSTGTIVLPETEPTPCEGMVFVGWTATENYSSATTAPTLVNAGELVAEGATFYAVFATQSGEGGAAQTTTYTFTSKAWADATNSWTGKQDGYAYDSGKQGVQVTAGVSGAGAETKTAMNNVSKIVVSYCTNATKGEGSIKMSVGSTEQTKTVTKTGGADLRNLEYTFNNASGKVGIEVTCTTNSIYIHSVAVTAAGGASYSNYTTSCNSGQTAIEHTEAEQPTAVKAIRNGQLVILRGNEVYSVTGVRLQ